MKIPLYTWLQTLMMGQFILVYLLAIKSTYNFIKAKTYPSGVCSWSRSSTVTSSIDWFFASSACFSASCKKKEITSSKERMLTCWHISLYWYNPSLALTDLFKSTHKLRYVRKIGSWIFCQFLCFLLLMTSYRTSKAASFLPMSINSKQQRYSKINFSWYNFLYLLEKRSIYNALELPMFIKFCLILCYDRLHPDS